MDALLDQCLTSLILDSKELREKMDIIVVIDGATDRSSEIAHRYADQYPEMFSVIDKENGNYGSCVNAALPRVQGKYVRILDADDSYYTNNLLDYIEVLEQQDADLILTDYDTVNEDGDVVSKTRLPIEANKSLLFSEIPSDMFIAMHEVAYRSEIFKEIDYHQTEGISYTDLEWVFHPMSVVRKVFYCNIFIYRYLNGRSGQTVNQSVILRRLSHVEKGLWAQLKVFQNITPDNMAYGYLKNVLIFRTKFIYQVGMDKKADYDLVSFDRKLQKYPLLYKEASLFTIPVGIFNMEMHFVRMWRIVKSRKGLYLFPLFDLHVLVNKLKKK